MRHHFVTYGSVDEFATNWHLYYEADEILKKLEELLPKLQRTYVRELGRKIQIDLEALVRLCDQHAG